jgi:hypothetical protein
MIGRIFVSLALALLTTPGLAQAKPDAKLKQELRSRETAAKKDVDQLFQVAKWAKAQKLDDEATRLHRAILKLKPDHQGANEALGNVLVEGKWMPAKEAEDLLKKKIAAEYAAKGLIEVDGLWVEKDQVEDAKRGIWRHDGEIVTRQEKLALLSGKVRHPETGELIPADALAKAKQPLFPIAGDRWVDQQEADKFHGDTERPWVVRSAYCTLVSTLPLAKVMEFRAAVDQGFERIAKLMGDKPPLPGSRPTVIIAATTGEYTSYGAALGDATSAFSAFLMRKEVHLKLPDVGDIRAAICDGTGQLGPYNARHAAALSYAYSKAKDAGATLPDWLLHGFGALASRFNNDSDGKFYGQRHLQRGGVGSLKGYFATFALNGDTESEVLVHLVYQAGLLLRFAEERDGDAAVSAALAALTTSLADPKAGGADAAIAAFQAAVIAAESKISAFLQAYTR